MLIKKTLINPLICFLFLRIEEARYNVFSCSDQSLFCGVFFKMQTAMIFHVPFLADLFTFKIVS